MRLDQQGLDELDQAVDAFVAQLEDIRERHAGLEGGTEVRAAVAVVRDASGPSSRSTG